ncbi:non-ribosomal peptide synthetase [uncultured Flavobacterium sp.]|uniref:non-ribosomal peptide synthetase n=1 Tax=uncultured Flavobacterium sp. TaxID=165435 RepID=UPI00292EABAA|nr:non-ribosomal peptide synthetase [uncultured Flavobacterium sp.]
MNDLKGIIDDLIKLNINIKVQDNELKITGSKENLTSDIISRIKENKSRLIDYFQSVETESNLITTNIIPKIKEEESYVISSSQRRLWMLSQFTDGSIAYNMPGIYIFEGNLDVQALNTAFKRLIQRHEILRTYFKETQNGEVLQVIVPSDEFAFEIEAHDLQGRKEQESELSILIHQEILTAFDLSRLPLLRANLYQLSKDKWAFSTVMHHIISDGWSMGIMIKELLEFYNAEIKAEAATLEELAIQYKDYAAWQQEQLKGAALESHRDYWLNQLKGELSVLDIATDRLRPQIKTYNGNSILRPLSPEVHTGIQTLSQEQGGTLFMGLLTGVTSLLYHYSAQEDIIIGSPIAGREHSALDGQIGFYLNTLALRLQFKGDASFKTLLQEARKTTLDAYAHQVFPFDQLIDELSLKRDLSRNVLFDVLIDYHDNRSVNKPKSPELEGLSVSGYQGDTPRMSKFDLTFMFLESDQGLSLLLEYNSDIYTEATAEAMFSHFEQLMQAAVTSPDKALNTLEYISAAERHQLTEEFNAVEFNYNKDTTVNVLDMFQEQVTQNPDATALHYQGTTLSYKELDVQSDNLAYYLQNTCAIQKGDLVGIMQDRSEKMIVSILGILKSGAAYVPIDPSYPQERKEYIISDTAIRILLTQTDYMFDLGNYTGAVFAVDAQLESLESHAAPIVELKETDLAYIIYTSGSTGQPKGCMLAHANLSHYIQWANHHYFTPETGNFGLYTSLSFDLTITSIFSALTRGKELTIYGQYGELSDILKDSFSAESGIDSIKLTPSHIKLLEQLNIESTTMTRAIVGGEAVSTAHVQILKKINPDIRIFNEYGPTETTVGCMVEELEENKAVLIGKPISGTKIYILGPSQELLPIGVAGEICIAGMGVGLGYLNQEALSAEKFTENPFVKGERMYRSGDIGRWQADGKLEYLGRKDDQVKIRGYRIEPGEIESVLQGHPSIATSAVVAQSNSQGDKELIAYLVSKDQDATLDVSDIRAYLSQHLPAYQVPAHYMQLESLPLTTNGKLDKTQLPSLDGLGSLRASEYVAPTTQREETIVGIWEEILNREPIGIRDDFFDLGGDSIKILRMMAGLRRELDLDVPIGEVYRQSTIESLLKHVDANKDVFDARNQTQNQHKVQVLEELEVLKSEILESLEDAQTIEDVYPMSDIEKGMIFESLVDSSKGMYHDQMVHQRIFKDFDPKRFENALRLLVYKHSILRTSFHMEGYATEVQMVHKDIDARLHYVNLRDQAREEQEKTIKDFLDNEMKSPFIVNTAPLWRMAAFDLGQDEVVFVFQCHHAIIDGWSDALFMTELNNLYLELEQNPAFSPTPLQSSYRDFIIEHEVAKRDPAIQTFWKEELKGYNRLTLFTEEEDISMSHYQLSKEEINTLEQFAKAHNTTVKAVSLGAYMYMLKVLSYNSEEIVTGLVSHMRPTCEDSDKLLGCFLNTIPFKVGVSNDISADKLIDGVHQKLIGLKDKERLSILEISLLHNKQGRQGNPFFDVLFDYVDFHAYGAIEEEKATEDQYNNLSGLSIGGIDLTNTFLDFIIDRTDGFYNLSIRLTHKLQCGFTTDRLAELYFAILSSMQEQPSAKLKDNDHLSQREQATLIEEFNTVEFNYNKDTTVNVLDLFQEQVTQNPDARALYYGGTTLSYKELDSQSDNLAYYLQNTCAIQKGDLVGIMQDRSEKMIVSILGILKSGAAYVPIDPSYPQERKEYIISDTAIRILLTQTDYMFDLGNYTGAVFAVDAQLESLESQTVSTKLTPSDLAYIIYTSGSTGQPKGCMLAHSNLSHYIQWANHHYFTPETGNFGLYTSLSFDLTITSIFSALTRGKELTIYGQYTELSDILKDSFSARSGIDSIKLTPSHIKLLEQLNIESTTMTRAIVGGEAVSTAHVQILKKINPDIRIFNEYGPTETTVGCMVEELEENKAVLIGKPISGTKIYILGPSLELLPIGVAGEICIAGMGVGLGYLNQETLSSEKFTENPFLRGERMYRSGDIGRWQADGKLEYLGRKDDQVKIRGYRIEPGEIESVLQGHPSIATSAVVAQSNSEGDKELIAYLVSKDQDATLDVSDIRTYLSQHLPSYQVPAHYMQLQSLPLTTNGKLDKAQLPSLDGLGTLKSHAYVAPRTQSEQQLAMIWQEILNREQIGIHDDFFELGGHSLTATRLASQLHKELGVKVELKDIFTYPVLEAQAALIDKSLKTAFEDIVPVAQQEAYELSSSQRRLWMLSQFTDGSVAYNMPGIYIFEGNLEIQALNTAFKGLIQRHEILRTYFKEYENGEVFQVIVPVNEFAFEIASYDLQHSKEQESELSTLIHKEILTAFDLSELPLLRANLYQLSANKWAFSTVMHHIISDGWSMGIMIKELLEFYNAEIKGEAVTLEELAIQYKDYAAWQQEQLKGAALESHRDYWLNQLSGELPVLDIATDKARPQIKTYNGSSILRPLSPQVHTGIQTLSQEQGGTLFMGLLSGVTGLLYHYSGQNDIIIGSPIAGREHSALDGQIGFYLNTLALRLEFKGEDSFKTLLQEARKTTLDAYAHQVFPFDQLIDELSLKRDLSRNVLFDVLIDYHDNRSVNKPKSPELEGLSVSGYQGDTPRMSKFDLTFMFLESDHGLSLLLEYNSDIYTEATAEAMFSHFEQLMQAAVASPDSALNTLDYLSKAEQEKQTEEFNAVEFNYNNGNSENSYINVLDLFKEQVTQNPDARALYYGGTTLSYKELDVQSDNLAYYLQNTCAIQKGDLVGIMQDRSEKMIVSILGILKSGAAYVPIDPSYPQERKEYIISDTAIRILLTQTDYMFDLGNYTGAVFAVDAQLESLESHAAPIVELKETDLAYIIYTSGSTGQPKGCMLAHANLSHYIQWANHHYFTPETGNFGLYTSLSFDLTITSIFSALTRGKELTIYGQYGELSDILKDSFSAESGIDSIKLTPSHIKLLEQLNIESTTMTRAIVGGEAVSTAHVQILKKINPDIHIYNEYGPTETTVGCMVEELEEDKTVLIGKPISGTKIYILGPSLELLPIGVAGEICIAGMGVGLGYLNQETLSAEKFTENPFVKGERMYRSGDIGRWQADGKLEYLGRKDDQVKIRGYRIEPGEIESVLQGHPSIAISAVVAQSNNEGDKELIAYLVSKETDTALDVSDIRAYLSQHLPSYQVPAHYMQLESLPLTTNGKLDKAQLPSLDGLGSLRASEYVAPTTQREETIVGIWEEILNREPIGIRDDFFDLGGDSIKILRMMAGLRRELDLDVPIGEVYRQSTIESLLKHVDANKDVFDARNQTQNQHKVQVLEELEVLKTEILASLEDAQTIEDIYPMSDIEKGMIFESLVDSSKGVYHDQKVFQRLFHNFEPKRFERALELLVNKHSILRTSFHMEGYATEVQMVHKDIDVQLYYVNLKDLAREEQEKTIKDFLSKEIESPFIVNQAPLWRMAAFNLGQDEVVFVFQCHHAIIDGWSETSFVTELNNLYLELEQNPTFSPAPLQSSYRDFIIEHEIAKRDPAIQSFWKQEMEGYNRLTLFTKEYDVQNYSGNRENISLKQIESVARELNTTVKVISLSAYLYMLKLLSYSDEIVAGLVTNMRPKCEDSDQLLGCFLNTIPLRLILDQSQSGEGLIAEIHEKLLVLKDMESLSTLEISNTLNKGAESGNPFFDVIFNYVDFHIFDSVEEDMGEGQNELQAVDINSQVLGNTYFDFTIDVTGGAYNIGVSVTRKLLSGYTAEKVGDLYFKILEYLIQAPAEKLDDLKYITEAEEKKILEEFNDTEKIYPQDKTIIDLFELQVARTPDAIALTFEDKIFTYNELNEHVNQYGHYLRENYALNSDDLVGIKLNRDEWMIISILAVLKAGAAYVPIDTEYPQSRIDYMLSDSKCKILLDEDKLEAYKQQQTSYKKENLAHVNKPSDLAYIIYTSGSTGLPKGVMVEHTNAYSFIKWCEDEFHNSAFDVVFGATSICFDLSVFEIFYTLCSGKELRLINNVLSAPQYLTTSKKVLLNTVPTAMKALLQQEVDLSAVTIINLAGEPVSLDILNKLDTTKIELRNLYGPSEDTTYSTVYQFRNDNIVSIGKPISNTEIYILNNSNALQTVGLIGEICISGAGLARGYINKPSLTAEKFVDNPFRPGERMYKTGDLGRWTADGNIDFLGRKDEQVKVRGYRIELGEIESCLQSYPEMETSVVTIVVNKEGENEIAAYVVGKQDFNASDLRKFLQAKLPIYMLPAHYIQLDQLPLTPSGKTDRRNLPSPSISSISRKEHYVAPRTETEKKVAIIWEETLEKDKIGVTDNFFEAGGHSLKVIQLIARINKSFDVDLSLRALFANPTIESLSNEIDNTYWASNEIVEVDADSNLENFSI